MDYLAWSEKNLEQIFLVGHTIKTSVWLTAPSDKPLIVLVHGINGSHTGLIPLAVELQKTFRVVLVDLPGHGRSQEMPIPDARTLQSWFVKTLEMIEREIGIVDLVCAHSFGCSVVLDSTVTCSKKVILLNPVPTPSVMYSRYSRLIVNSAHFWAHIYNWPIFVLLRGMTLTKINTQESLQRVRWVGRNSPSTYRQIIFQATLVNIILDKTVFNGTKSGDISLVISGMFDTTAVERDTLDMQAVFGDTELIFLSGGHLLPIETPSRVAHLINDAMVH